MKTWTIITVCLAAIAAGCERTTTVVVDEHTAAVTADHLEIRLPLRELQMRAGEPMVAIHAELKDGGAASLVLVFDPLDTADAAGPPATVLIDAAQHTIAASFWEMHGDASSTGGPMFLDSARVEGDLLILREAGPLHELITKEHPQTLHWKPGGEADAAPPRVIRLRYDGK